MCRLMALIGGARLMQIQQALRRSIDGALSMQRLLVAPGQEWFRVSSQSLRSFATDSDLHIRFTTTRNAKLGEIPDINNAFGAMSLERKKDADNDNTESLVKKEEQEEDVKDEKDRKEEDDATVDKLKNLVEVKLACASAGQQFNSTTKKAERMEIITEIVKKIRDDVQVIGVVETNKNKDRTLLRSALGSDWEDGVGSFSTTNILCFWNKAVLGESATFRSDHGRLVSLEVPYIKDAKKHTLYTIIVHLPRKASSRDPTSDERCQAHKHACISWDRISSKDPAIAIGDFNLTPCQVNTLFVNGSVAFKNGQLPTNARVNKIFTDNAYANRQCELINTNIYDADGLEHKVFVVHYKLL